MLRAPSDEEQQRMVDILPLLRPFLGFNQDHFANLIGLTYSTISRIENNQVKLGATRYFAIRYVALLRIREEPDLTRVANIILQAFITRRKSFTDEDRAELMKQAKKGADFISSNKITPDLVEKAQSFVMAHMEEYKRRKWENETPLSGD